MMKKISKITFHVIGGANIGTILLMFLIGHADLLSPMTFPKLSNIGLIFPAMLAINFFFIVLWIFLKPRYVIIPILGFIICFGPVRRYMPLNVPHNPPKGCLKILSYNVWYYAGWTDIGRPNTIIQYIRRQNADIVCLQESSLSDVHIEELDSVLNPIYHYTDTLMHGGDVMTVFSKYPIMMHEHIDFPSHSNMSGAFLLKVRGRDVLVVNNHLETTKLNHEAKERFKELMKGKLERDTATRTSKWLITHLGEQTKKRSVEADAVARYIAYHHDMPVIVCGDFNDSPLSYVHRVISEGLTDCYVATGNGPGFSYHRSGMYVRIDNIMCNDFFEPYACRVDNSIDNSDHYPIMCYLKMK